MSSKHLYIQLFTHSFVRKTGETPTSSTDVQLARAHSFAEQNFHALYAGSAILLLE